MNSDSLKEKVPHGTAMFPLDIHFFNSDLRLNERLYVHWHEELEFLIVTEGEADFHTDGRKYRVRAGDIIFVNSNCLHSATGVESIPFDFFAVVFSPALLVSYANDSIQQKYIDPVLDSKIPFPEHIVPCEDWSLKVLTNLNAIRDIYLKKDAAFELLIKIRIYEIWYILCTYSERLDTISVQNNDYRISRIKSVLHYMHGSYRRKITISELSSRFNMSEGSFCRFFKSMVKMSVVNYINYYRINESVMLLQQTDKEIGEIACSVGFNNISYFNKIFRKYMHCSPSEYRFPFKKR